MCIRDRFEHCVHQPTPHISSFCQVVVTLLFMRDALQPYARKSTCWSVGARCSCCAPGAAPAWLRRGSPHGRAIPAQRTPASRLCADPLSADQTGRRRRANGKGEMRRWGMRLHPRRGAAGDAPCIYNKLYSKIALTSTAHLRRSVTRRMYVEL